MTIKLIYSFAFRYFCSTIGAVRVRLAPLCSKVWDRAASLTRTAPSISSPPLKTKDSGATRLATLEIRVTRYFGRAFREPYARSNPAKMAGYLAG